VDELGISGGFPLETKDGGAWKLPECSVLKKQEEYADEISGFG
jgi:hypothetical protein